METLFEDVAADELLVLDFFDLGRVGDVDELELGGFWGRHGGWMVAALAVGDG